MQLTKTLECHYPLTLLFQRNKNLRVSLEFFLKSMYNIRVLDFHNTIITLIFGGVPNRERRSYAT